MTKHQTDQVVLTSGVAVAVLHGRETSVIVEQQVVLFLRSVTLKLRESNRQKAAESSEKAKHGRAIFREQPALLISGHARARGPVSRAGARTCGRIDQTAPLSKSIQVLPSSRCTCLEDFVILLRASRRGRRREESVDGRLLARRLAARRRHVLRRFRRRRAARRHRAADDRLRSARL